MPLPLLAVLDGDGQPVNSYGLNSGRQAANDSAAVALSTEDKAALDLSNTKLESMISAQGSGNTKLDSVISALNTIDGRVDGLEALLTTANTAIKAEDAAHASGDAGHPVWTVRKDTAATTAGSDGDYAAFTTDASGKLYVNTGLSNPGDATAANQSTIIGHVDGIEAGLTTLNASNTAIQAAMEATATINVAQDTAVLKNGATSLTPKFAPISASSSGDNVLVAAVTGKKIRVLQYLLNGNGAVNAKFRSDTSGTPTDISGLHYIDAAGRGAAPGFTPVGMFETASGKNLGINLSGAVAVGGWLVYVEV